MTPYEKYKPEKCEHCGQTTTLSRPRFHGLIAYVHGKRGYYCLTQKAGKFLRGEAIPKYAIISKITGHQIGYWEPEKYKVTLREILRGEVRWEGDVEKLIDYLDPRPPVSNQIEIKVARLF